LPKDTKKDAVLAASFFQSLFVSAASSQTEQTSGANAARMFIKKKKLKNRFGFIFIVGA